MNPISVKFKVIGPHLVEFKRVIDGQRFCRTRRELREILRKGFRGLDQQDIGIYKAALLALAKEDK